MRVTHKLIADSAGVSVSTVSRALANHPRISADERLRIQNIASKLGYAPNPFVSALMAHRRNRKEDTLKGTVALMDCFLTYPEWKNKLIETIPWGAAIIRKAKQLGYNTEIYRLSEMSPTHVERILRARNITGLILGPSQTNKIPATLHWDRYCMATVGYISEAPFLHSALNNDYQSMVSILNGAIAKGYKRIALATDNTVYRIIGEAWLSAFLTVRHLNPSLDWPEPYLSGNGSVTDFLSWLEATKPDLVISTIRVFYLGVLQSGYSIPRDMAWIHLHELSDHPETAYLEHNPDALASAAVNLVVGQILRNERGIPEHPMKVLIQDRFHYGKTFPDLPRIECLRLH